MIWQNPYSEVITPNPNAPTPNSFVKKGIRVITRATPMASIKDTSSMVRLVMLRTRSDESPGPNYGITEDSKMLL